MRDRQHAPSDFIFQSTPSASDGGDRIEELSEPLLTLVSNGIEILRGQAPAPSAPNEGVADLLMGMLKGMLKTQPAITLLAFAGAGRLQGPPLQTSRHIFAALDSLESPVEPTNYDPLYQATLAIRVFVREGTSAWLVQILDQLTESADPKELGDALTRFTNSEKARGIEMKERLEALERFFSFILKLRKRRETSTKGDHDPHSAKAAEPAIEKDPPELKERYPPFGYGGQSLTSQSFAQNQPKRIALSVVQSINQITTIAGRENFHAVEWIALNELLGSSNPSVRAHTAKLLWLGPWIRSNQDLLVAASKQVLPETVEHATIVIEERLVIVPNRLQHHFASGPREYAKTLTFPLDLGLPGIADLLFVIGQTTTFCGASLQAAEEFRSQLNEIRGNSKTTLSERTISKQIEIALDRISGDGILSMMLKQAQMNVSLNPAARYRRYPVAFLRTRYQNACASISGHLHRFRHAVGEDDNGGSCKAMGVGKTAFALPVNHVVELLDDDDAVGSLKVPKANEITELVRNLKREASDRMGHPHLTKVARLHTAQLRYTVLTLRLSLGCRPSDSALRSIGADSGGVIFLAEKAGHARATADQRRAVPLTLHAVKQLSHWKTHAAAMRAAYSTTSDQRHVFFDIDLKAESLVPCDWDRFAGMTTSWIETGNANRHFYSTALTLLGTPGFRINALLGHSRPGDGVHEIYSATPPMPSPEEVRALDELLLCLGLVDVPGYQRRRGQRRHGTQRGV